MCSLDKKLFVRGVIVGLIVVFFSVLIFTAGYFLGQSRLKKEQFCFKPSRLPVALRRVFEQGLGGDFLSEWQGRAVLGKVVALDYKILVLETVDGLREIEINDSTRYLRGRTPIKKVEVKIGQEAAVLLDQEKQAAKVVVISR